MLNGLERNSDWIQTYTGRQFWPLDPRPEDVCIEDIAHALSLMCRFTGHCNQFYSVAEHSVRVYLYVHDFYTEAERENAGPLPSYVQESRKDVSKWALLHDASEAYLHDLPRPLKRAEHFGDLYKAHEARLMKVICSRFGLSSTEPTIVKRGDTVLLLTEQRDLMKSQIRPWRDTAEPLAETIVAWPSVVAKAAFLRVYGELFGGIYATGL